MLLPGIKHVEKCEMVSILMVESRLLLIRELLLLLWSIKDVLYLDHRSNGENFIYTTQIDCRQEHFGKLWLDGEFSHHSSNPRK